MVDSKTECATAAIGLRPPKRKAAVFLDQPAHETIRLKSPVFVHGSTAAQPIEKQKNVFLRKLLGQFV